jgi:hypothetical protein
MATVTLAVAGGNVHAAPSEDRSDLEACVRRERAARPALRYLPAVVRCAKIDSASTVTTVRWTTCAKAAPVPGDRCETGSARIVFRAQRSSWDWRIKEPPGAQAWHLTGGTGTITCLRTRHGVPTDDRRSRTEFHGARDHLDGLVWPTGRDGMIAAGIYHSRGGGFTAQRGDGTACTPLLADSGAPPGVVFPIAELLSPAVSGTAAVTRSAPRSAFADLGLQSMVGTRIVLTVRATTTLTFGIRRS